MNQFRMIWFYCVCIGLVVVHTHAKGSNGKVPVIVITDCYHPYQDPGDNLDLINGFSNPYIDLRGIILDITHAFRKDTADHPTLWKDPRGPREAGFIPVMQMNYIFNRDVPCGIGPLEMMKSETDCMEGLPAFQETGLTLLFDILENNSEQVEILSFGSARILAVAYNRKPRLIKEKVKRIHLSGGTASKNYAMGSDEGANMIPGGEWNVALDVFAFTRLLRSDLPVAIYPCAGIDGGFVKDPNNSYWTLKDLSFIPDMDIRLQNYLDYAFNQRREMDFLQQMDNPVSPFHEKRAPLPCNFHVWETAIWQQVAGWTIVKNAAGNYRFRQQDEIRTDDRILESTLRSCTLEVRDDGRFEFFYTTGESNFSVYYRDDMEENEKALNILVPTLLKNIQF